MNWSAMAATTLEAMGEPVAFFRNGHEILETSGIYRNQQQLKRSKNKSLRVVDADVVTVPFSDLVQSGDEVQVNGLTMFVAGKPKRDGSGGMVVRLAKGDSKQTNTDRFDR